MRQESRHRAAGCPIAVRSATLVVLATLSPMLPDPPCNRQDDRIWGRVTANDGLSHEGYLHFLGSGGGATWADPLLGSREISDDDYQLWLQGARGGVPHLGVVEVEGYRVTWEERYPDFAQPSRAPIRFGHIASISLNEEEGVVVEPWGPDGEPGSGAAGAGGAVPRIEVPWLDNEVRIETSGSRVTLRWKEIARIDLSPVPAGDSGRTAPRPLWGSAVDSVGRSYTGWLSWGAVRLESDSLGKIIMRHDSVSDSVLRDIAQSEIARLEGAATVERTGAITRSVRPGSVRVAAPELGVVEIPYGAIRSLRVAPGPAGRDTDAARCRWHRGWPLAGTVTTSGGEEIEGRIRWNSLKGWSWELLQGSSRGVDFLVAFSEIELMERDPEGGLRVSLADGRMLHLTEGGDVDEGNRGVLVWVESGRSWQRQSGGWRHVAWSEIGEVRLRHRRGGELGR